jgi:hypothetical protein
VFGPEWGSPGDEYVFSAAAAVDRMASHGSIPALIAQVLEDLGDFVVGTKHWFVPVRYARAQIHATLPGPEQIIHSLAYRPVDESVTVTPSVLVTLAQKLAVELGSMLAGPGPGTWLSNSLIYNQINISYIEQNSGTDKNGKGGDQKTLVPTVQVPITVDTRGGSTNPMLPYEVALCLTLQTDTRSPTTRGRVYLGGLTTQILGTAGKFDTAGIGALAVGFGTHLVKNVHDTTSWRLNVVSRRTASAREVQGIAVGVIPDSQRRRRNALSESPLQGWGTPPGAILPG